MLSILFPGGVRDQANTSQREQHQDGSAPGPASEAVIQALPKKTVTKDILNGDSEAKCAICKEADHRPTLYALVS